MHCTICNASVTDYSSDICDECRVKINQVFTPELEVELSVIPKTGDFGGRVERKRGQP